MSRLSLFGRDMDGNEPKFLGWAEYSSIYRAESERSMENGSLNDIQRVE
jgi:hypothetical protein